MRTQFSTSTVHRRDRFDFWHEIACRKIVHHASRPHDRLTFEAEIKTGLLGGLGLIVFRNSPMHFDRAKGHISHADDDDIFICRQMSGGIELEQEGRKILLAAGDMMLVDPCLPYRGDFWEESTTLVLKVPRRSLEARLGDTRDKLIRRVGPNEGEGSLASSFLATLPGLSQQLQPHTSAMVQEQALDLFAASLMHALGARNPKLSCARSLAVMKVRAAIEARLSDADLDVSAVAAAAGISVRYASAVLADDGTSINRLIQARRLERCRQALADPLQSHRQLSDIAYGWGFSDMTHFTRSFKRTYGQVPSQYRKRLS